jgi:diadenylate cyclase
VSNIEAEAALIIKDYSKNSRVDPFYILNELKKLSSEELLEENAIVRLLGYHPSTNIYDEPVKPRGYRILHKIPRLPSLIIENLVNHFGHLQKTIKATIEDLDDVEGIGEIRARKIKDGLKRIQEQLFIDRHI